MPWPVAATRTRRSRRRDHRRVRRGAAGGRRGLAYLVLRAVRAGEPLARRTACTTGELARATAAGYAVAFAGDTDGDGLDDLPPRRVRQRRRRSGGGPPTCSSGRRPGPSSPSATAVLVGEDPSDAAGYDVAAAGILDGDGLADVIVGAYGDDSAGATPAPPTSCSTPVRHDRPLPPTAG